VNVAELPPSYLRSCQFGEGGVPAGQIIEEGAAGLRGEGSSMATRILLIHDDLVVEFADDEAD
jgi:hypothetical protein